MIQPATTPRQAAIDREIASRVLARRHLFDFMLYMWPQYRPAKFHKRLCEVLERWARGEIKRLVVTLPPQHGKALALDTPIPTPHGFKPIGSLRVGDEVFAGDGTITRVKGVSPIWRNRRLYRVTSDDGASVVADEKHEWTLRLDRGYPVLKVYETGYLANRSCTRKPMLPPSGAIDLPAVALPIPPFTLGVWLGDGTSSTNEFTKRDSEHDYFLPRIESEGVGVAVREAKVSSRIRLDGMRAKLREIGLLKNKHIPECYFWASIEQRTALLQGLVDTDGHVHPDGQVEFASTNERLALGVQRLVRSLGRKARLLTGRARLYGKDCGPSYRVMFYMADAAGLPRKAERCRDAEKKPGRYLSFEPAGRGDTICIEVEHPSHLFLCGEGFMVTHNSSTVSEYLQAWILGNWPDERTVTASYGAEFVAKWGRSVRRIVSSKKYQRLFPGVRLGNSRTDGVANTSVEFDIVGKRGGYKAVGRGGPLTGHPFHRGVIDDPFKDREEASSETIRESCWSWYTGVFYTRQNPIGNAPICVLHTRWHEDDLIGRLLEQEKQGGEKWVVVNFPAIAEDDRSEYDEREPGEPLWMDRDTYDRIRITVGPRDWASLYQQRPAPETGGIFKAPWLAHYFTVLAEHFDFTGHEGRFRCGNGRRFATLDAAVQKADTNDYTAIGVWEFQQDRLFLLDMVRERLDGPDIIRRMHELRHKWALGEIHVEEVVWQILLIQQARKEGLPVRAWKPIGKKAERAYSATPWFEQGKVLISRALPVLDAYRHEMLSFTADESHKHDDMVDVTTMACAIAWGKGGAGILRGNRPASENVSANVLAGIAPSGRIM